MMSASEARLISFKKIEEDRSRALEMMENLIRLTAECGKFSATVEEDDVYTRDTLRRILEHYEQLGYVCQIETVHDDEFLTISW